MGCDLFNAARKLAERRGLNLPGQCPVEIDCGGVSCSVAHLGEEREREGLVQQYEGRANRFKFEARVQKSVTLMQAQH